MYIVTNGHRVIRFFSKSLIGSQLNWSAREKECYGIYYGVKLFEDLMDNRILHILMWHSLVRSYDGSSTCRIRTLIYSIFPAKNNINLYLMHYQDCVRIMYLHLLLWLKDA